MTNRTWAAVTFALVVLFLPLRGTPQSDIAILPATESEAECQLAHGLLDSALWRRIRPYYAEPIKVRAGELVILREVLRCAVDWPLPTSSDTLSAYHPWSADEVQRFFRDYPHLAGIAPILSFEPSRSGRRGRIGVRIARASRRGRALRYVTAKLTPVPALAVSSRMAFRNGSFTWYRRDLRLHVGRGGTITLGNYVPVLDDGLVIGHFPRADSAREFGNALVQRLLLGESRTYNGLKWHIRTRKDFRAEAFYHESISERFGAFRMEGPVASWLTLSGGATACLDKMGMVSSDGAGLGFHGGADAAWRRVEASVRLCLYSRDLGKVPFEADLSYSDEGNRFAMRVTRVPSGYAAPRSRIAYRLHDELDSAAETGVTAISLTSRHEMREEVVVSPSLAYVFSQTEASSRVTITAATPEPVGINVRYCLDPSLLSWREYARHTAYVTIGEAFCRWFSAEGRFRWYLREGRSWNSSAEVLLRFSWGEGPSVAPFITGRWSSLRSPAYGLGIRQEMRLAGSATGSFRIEAPAVRDGWEEVRVNGSLVFRL